jgi:hypothetical protein
MVPPPSTYFSLTFRGHIAPPKVYLHLYLDPKSVHDGQDVLVGIEDFHGLVLAE